MLKPVFKSEQLQNEFERDGYVVARQLIPSTVVKHLRQVYFKYEKEHWGDKLGMHSTAHTDNFDILREIHQTLVKYTAEYADRYLTNYKFYLGNFLVKESREDSLFDMHQDWTCVDEPDYCSFNFWMDLEGMNKANGRLFFVKGTHHLRPGLLRFAPICPSPWQQIKNIAPSFYTYLDTKPGDVVFLNNATLHGSVKNHSGNNRIAAVLGAYSADAPLLHYYLKPGDSLDKVERHLVTTENLITMPRGQRPPGSIFDGYVAYDTPEITSDEFIRFMMQQYTLKEKAFFYLRKIGRVAA
ncbi:MAG: phytanoyl-CoA dioxygenase family protein [Bacteroidota bacterium]